MPRKPAHGVPPVGSPAREIAPGGLLADAFQGPSWDLWRVILRAAWGEALDDAELEQFHEVAGDRPPPTEQVRELWCICGRGGGKDSIASGIATTLALRDYRPFLRPGEAPTILALACDRVQAGIVQRYIAGYFHEYPLLRPLVARETDDGLELTNGVVIAVGTNNYRAVRGRTVVCGILDEAAFYRTDNAASSDFETYQALRPALARVPGSMLIGISTPYKRGGLLFERWQRHFGKASDGVLVVRGGTLLFNSNADQLVIAEDMARDPDKAAAEYYAEWRSDISDFIGRDLLDAAVDQGVVVRPPQIGTDYAMFVDASGGRGDSFAAGVAHLEADTAILDALVERRSPFNPTEVVAEVGELAQSYWISSVVGDKYAASWVSEAFAKVGVNYEQSERDRSAVYLDTLPLFTSGRVRLLDNPRLVHQFSGLERHTGAAGKDSVPKPKDGADDLANAAAGALVEALGNRPALVHQRSLLGAAAVSVPRWCDCVFSSTWVGEDGAVATCYFAAHENVHITDPAMLTLVDCDVGSLTPNTVRNMANRLAEVRGSIARSPNAEQALVPKGLMMQVSIEGYHALVHEDTIVRDLPSLPLALATHMHAGRFRVAAPAAVKAREIPLAAALSFRPGGRIEDDPLKLAILYGAAWWLRCQ